MPDTDLSDMIVTEVCSVIRLTNGETGWMKQRNRRQWAVALKLTGRTVYSFAGKQTVSDVRHPVLLPKGGSYEWRCTEPGDCVLIEFDGPSLGESPVGYFVRDTARVQSIIERVERRLKSDKPLAAMKNCRDLYEILLILFETRTSEYTPPDRAESIRPAVLYMDDHFSENGITNEFLAGLCGISTVYFRKMFRQCFGSSPIAYINAKRMERAKELLRSDYISVTQIAETVGYSSLYHFSKMFRKYTGVSPTDFAGR